MKATSLERVYRIEDYY